MPLRLRLLRADELGWFGTADAFAGHFADDLGGGEDFFLALARHGPDAAFRNLQAFAEKTGHALRSKTIRIFAHSTRKSAIISGRLRGPGIQSLEPK